MCLELDLYLGRVMDQVEATVQDQGLDMDQVQTQTKLKCYVAGISKLNNFCYSQVMEMNHNQLYVVLKCLMRIDLSSKLE